MESEPEYLIGVRLHESAQADDYKLVGLDAHVGDLVVVETGQDTAVGEAQGGRARHAKAQGRHGAVRPPALLLVLPPALRADLREDGEGPGHAAHRQPAAGQLRTAEVLSPLRVLDLPGAPVAPATGQHAVPGLVRRRGLHGGQGDVDPRAQADGCGRLPRWDGGGSAARPAHLGGAAPHPGPARGLVTDRARVVYLTTPIYYVNDRPHLGHAYTTIAADTMARYHRLAGDDVRLLTGTDEHGDKIGQAAAHAGGAPPAVGRRHSAPFRQAWEAPCLANDAFIRTTEPRHTKVVQAILQTLWEAGEIYLGNYGGQYCFW